MLIGRYGFPSMVRLLEAFDRGHDLDRALGDVFQLTPEQLDLELERFIAAKVAGLAVEPRWNPDRLPRLRLSLPREAPEDEAGIARWNDTWCTLAWAAWQSGRRVDAEEALRRLVDDEGVPSRALFLGGVLGLASNESERAAKLWQTAFDMGGEDFRARIALGTLRWQAGELESAELHFLAAEKAFPGYAEAELSAELRLSGLYTQQKREDEAMRALERRLAWEAGDFGGHVRVADWYAERDDCARAAELYARANEVDPFVRSLHRSWALALFACERYEEALREFGVALMVPPGLDLEQPGPLGSAERAELIGRQALCLARLGRHEEARAKAEQAFALDADCAPAREALELSD
jgi:tetratricopeptide (TPR) repeat protein